MTAAVELAKTQTGAYASAAPRGYRAISVEPASPRIGAEIGDIDLTRPLSPTQVDELKHAFADYQVLFFRGQKISHEDHLRLASIWGNAGIHVGGKTNSKLTDDPRVRIFRADASSQQVSGDVWHTDQSCAPVPPLGSILYIHTVPPHGGGDTLFASMYAAYDGLSAPMKLYLEGLTARHDAYDIFGPGTPTADHPVIAVHPETGRKLIFVNRAFTRRINEVPEEESRGVLQFLFNHCALPEFSMRFRWEPHSIAFWDNRCVHHHAVFNYWPHTRSGFRVQIEGVEPPRPVGRAR
jgi:taurine dioxygenase